MTKKTKPKQPVWAYCELYRENIYYFKGYTQDEFLKEVPEAYFAPGLTYGGKMTHTSRGVCIWVSPKLKYKTPFLVHEIIHAANSILLSKGVKADTENDEALAYLAQWITSKILTDGKYE